MRRRRGVAVMAPALAAAALALLAAAAATVGRSAVAAATAAAPTAVAPALASLATRTSHQPRVEPSPADVTAPVTTATGTDGRWHRQEVTLTFAATDVGGSGVAFTEVSVDGGPFAARTTLVVRAPRDHANDGAHTILYRSADLAGNVEADRSCVVRIDTRPPGFRWVSVRPAVLHQIGPETFTFRLVDHDTPLRLTLSIYNADGVRVRRIGGLTCRPGLRTVRWSGRYASGRPALPGLYFAGLTVVDQAGNGKLTSRRRFRDERPVKPTVWFHVAGAGPRVALTFDDGGSKSAWARILGTLRASHAKATFFPTGRMVAAYPTLARATVAQGNAVGSHGYSHMWMTSHDSSAVARDLALDKAVWWRVAHVTPVPYMRPPYGDYDSRVVSIAGAQGFARVIIWNGDGRDWAGAGSAEIASRVISGSHSGSIVCLHVLPTTAGALPAIIRGLRAKGLRPVTLPQLFRAAGCR